MYAGIILTLLTIGCAWVYHRTQIMWRDNKIEQLEERSEVLESELDRTQREYVAYIMSQQTGRCEAFLERVSEDISALDDEGLRDELEQALEDGDGNRVNELLDELNNRG